MSTGRRGQLSYQRRRDLSQNRTGCPELSSRKLDVPEGSTKRAPDGVLEYVLCVIHYQLPQESGHKVHTIGKYCNSFYLSVVCKRRNIIYDVWKQLQVNVHEHCIFKGIENRKIGFLFIA